MTGLRAMLIGGVVHCAAWLGFELVVESLMSQSPCQEIYGLISGFWASLYVGLVLRVPLAAFVPAAVIYIITSLVSGSASIGFPRRASDFGPPGLLNTLPWAILFGVPIVVNHCVSLAQRLAEAWRQTTGTDAE